MLPGARSSSTEKGEHVRRRTPVDTSGFQSYNLHVTKAGAFNERRSRRTARSL